jgi:metal-responsive CopG/Arc/MetJ family transcriptional regulator
VEYTLDKVYLMETIPVALNSKLLRATDAAARRSKMNRSALIREALREHLKRLKIRELEYRDRRGYAADLRNADELFGWESEEIWPEQ